MLSWSVVTALIEYLHPTAARRSWILVLDCFSTAVLTNSAINEHNAGLYNCLETRLIKSNCNNSTYFTIVTLISERQKLKTISHGQHESRGRYARRKTIDLSTTQEYRRLIASLTQVHDRPYVSIHTDRPSDRATESAIWPTSLEIVQRRRDNVDVPAKTLRASTHVRTVRLPSVK